MRAALLAGVIAGFLVVAAAWEIGKARFDGPGPNETEIIVQLPRGTSLTQIASTLDAAGAIDTPRLFSVGVRLSGYARMLKAGEYAIAPRSGMRTIMLQIADGAVVHHRLTIPEGWEIPRIMARIAEAETLSGDLPPPPPEGSLLPETYVFPRGESRIALIARMRTAHTVALERLWQARAADLPFDTPQEAVILASIVEKETAIAAERPLIAGVFVNRLRNGMRLQSDPTVTYAMTVAGISTDRELTRKDLKRESPYNTYLIAALPPSPIGNPGLAALRAVLHPAKTDALYFVADGTGGHAFAESLSEHNTNVARFRRLKRAMEKPTPHASEQENLPTQP